MPSPESEAVVDGIACMLMRGGTSKGAYFLASDLPAAGDERDDLLLRVMGSPDPTQIDGIGGAHPLTSKVAVVAPSAEPGIDVDYLFLQVGVAEATVGTAQTCGNMLAGVGPFAIERGLVAVGPELTSVRIRLVNTGDVAVASVPTPRGRVDYAGHASIDGVPGTAAPIEIQMESAAERHLLPTGNITDEIDGLSATLIDNGMPIVVVDGADVGITGAEDPSQLESRPDIAAVVDRLRAVAGPLMGLGDTAALTVPKVIFTTPPQQDGDIATRAFIPARVHPAIGVLMAASVAAAAQIPGTPAHRVARHGPHGQVVIEHPSGTFTAFSRVENAGGTWRSTYSANLRTARKLFDGRVFPRPRSDIHPFREEHS